MKISSRSFVTGEPIAARFAMRAIPGGRNLSPQVSVHDVPKGTKSLALTVIDRHRVAKNWIHWLVINIPPSTVEIEDGSSMKSMPAGSVELINTFDFKGYGGPQPPKGSGEHQYEIAVYALSTILTPPDKGISETAFLKMIKSVTIESDKTSSKFAYK
jgi:Raf kinase inhibitor-like YbhB/YbcL family protein